MKTNKNKANPVWILIMITSILAVRVQAEPSRPSLFPKNSCPVFASTSLGGQRFPGNEQAGWRGTPYGPEAGNGVLMIIAGVAGNVVGAFSGAALGRYSYGGIILGGLAGSTLGSALGVYLAGSSDGRRGDFAAALGGSLLGEALAFGLALAIRTEEAPFMAGFLILPPIGAALLFNSSQRYRSVRAGNGLLNLAEGKLGLGVPDVQVSPSCVPGLKAKPELRFNVRVLSVEL